MVEECEAADLSFGAGAGHISNAALGNADSGTNSAHLSHGFWLLSLAALYRSILEDRDMTYRQG